MHHTEFVWTQIEYAVYFSVSEIVWTWPQIVKATCRLLMRALIDDCHWRLHSITTSKKKYNSDFTNLYRLHYLRRLQSIAEKRGNKAAEQHCAKKKTDTTWQPETWETQTALNGTKPDSNWVRNFPSRPLTCLKPKYFCPSDTHWHEYVEYGLRLLYYCILHWGRPVSKSRQIELSHIASRTNMRRFWYVAISKILNALIALLH